MTTPFSPSSPPRLHVEPLPDGTLLLAVRTSVSNRNEAIVEITAWLPDGWATNDHIGGSSSDDNPFDIFHEDHCQSCDYYFDDRELTRSEIDSTWTDSEGVDHDILNARITVESPCPCCRNGISSVDWPCTAGYDEPEDDDNNDSDLIRLGPMAFTARRRLTRLSPFGLDLLGEFTARLQAVNQSQDGRWRRTAALRAGNTFDGTDAVCWGNDNDTPASLAEAAAAYADAPGNNDLLSRGSFVSNIQQVRRLDPHVYLDGLHLAPPPGEPGPWGLLVASAAVTPEAFLLLAASGAPSAGGLAIALAHWHDAIPAPDGTTFSGWLSTPLAGSQCWLAAPSPTDWEGAEALLLGQLPEPIATSTPHTLPCTSPQPCSSALVALAAN